MLTAEIPSHKMPLTEKVIHHYRPHRFSGRVGLNKHQLVEEEKMKHYLKSWSRIVSVIFGVALAAARAQANISGFGDFSGFTVNQTDSNAAPTVSAGSIHLTNQHFDEDRSIFANTVQNISAFTASFTYQVSNLSACNTSGGGAAFVIQNSSSGASAVQTSIAATMVGNGGISPSAAITLELYGSNSTSSGYYTNGGSPNGSPSTSPVNLASHDPIDVTISYNGSLLQESLVDTVTSGSYSTSYLANIPSIVGGSTAYVGITAANGLQEEADQVFSNFQFTAGVPEPASLSLVGIGAIAALKRRRTV